jgi:hypothetical protein
MRRAAAAAPTAACPGSTRKLYLEVFAQPQRSKPPTKKR